ncbi:hypothetical protein [Ignavibacterium sp.]|uniref:hypothetical protein n=1 Tax=Ignavibacterium sp. TaxID=2651167 RepID=UPI0021F9B737|nr:hypothetical protein [Ignavibacterium sp.]BDQ02542.1 MAG: hypothetical protein KatS3mg037_1117 [Ignavibacterium sp.]
MPLIEIINITLLAFSVGLLALMGISYLVYRYRESSNKSVKQNVNDNLKLIPKEIKEIEKPTVTTEKKSTSVSRYQIIKTYTQSVPLEKKTTNAAEKFLVVNKNISSLRKTHSPKFIYLVTSPSNR